MLTGALRYSNILCRFPPKVLIHVGIRHFKISNANLVAKNSLSKQGKFINKLIFGSSKKKRKFVFDDSQVPSGNKLSLGQKVKNTKENSRRVAVLNSLFMKHISDLLVTGNMGVDIVSKGLEISRVSMNSDFHQVNVYWGCNKNENITELEDLLPNISYTLRHELTQLRVMGIVPRILFIKDKHFTDGAKVDYLLGIADYGEDHEPLELESDFKNTTISPNESRALNKEQTSEGSSPPEDEEEVPPMRQDTFNLDHQHIMNKILKRMQKSRAIHRYEPNLAIKSDGNNVTSDIQGAEEITKEERKEAISKFILSRKILQEKKMKNKYSFDSEFYRTHNVNDEDVEDEEFTVEDYIEDDYEEDKFKN